jgi:hypothetical protein
MKPVPDDSLRYSNTKAGMIWLRASRSGEPHSGQASTETTGNGDMTLSVSHCQLAAAIFLLGGVAWS